MNFSARQKRQRDIHPVVDVGMIIVEFFVTVFDAGGLQTFRQDAHAIVNVVLIA